MIIFHLIIFHPWKFKYFILLGNSKFIFISFSTIIHWNWCSGFKKICHIKYFFKAKRKSKSKVKSKWSDFQKSENIAAKVELFDFLFDGDLLFEIYFRTDHWETFADFLEVKPTSVQIRNYRFRIQFHCPSLLGASSVGRVEAVGEPALIDMKQIVISETLDTLSYQVQCCHAVHVLLEKTQTHPDCRFGVKINVYCFIWLCGAVQTYDAFVIGGAAFFHTNINNKLSYLL